jgi:regulator of replication initiation timing
MSDESRILVLSVEVERLRQDNDRLRLENAALRPRVSELEHKIRTLRRAMAETEALERKDSDHA